MSREDTEKWYREMLADEDRVWFAIVLKRSDRVIGEAGLLRMFRPWRSTNMTIIIGEKNEWGKGYGTEVGHLLLHLAFGQLGFHRVSIGMVGFNMRALRLLGKSRIQEGRCREGCAFLRRRIQRQHNDEHS